MRLTITGASGLIGRPLVEALRARGDDVTILSRDPQRGVTWDPLSEPAPVEALAGRDAVIHLAGENVAQRWTDKAKRSIRESRVIGTQALLEGLRAAEDPPRRARQRIGGRLLRRSRRRGARRGSADPGERLAGRRLRRLGGRRPRGARPSGCASAPCGPASSSAPNGGALAKMLPPFRVGLGGPVAGGDQYMPWIHLDDVVGMYLAALDGPGWTGPVNATGPAPVTNREFSKALGRALHRPAIAPVPGLAVRLLFGEMSEIVTGGQRAVPRRAAELGYDYATPSSTPPSPTCCTGPADPPPAPGARWWLVARGLRVRFPACRDPSDHVLKSPGRCGRSSEHEKTSRPLRITGLLASRPALCLLGRAATALANTSHAGWPPITGMLLINKYDQSRPLDGRPGSDPFDGTDYSASVPDRRHALLLRSRRDPRPVRRRTRTTTASTCSALEAAEAALVASSSCRCRAPTARSASPAPR